MIYDKLLISHNPINIIKEKAYNIQNKINNKHNIKNIVFSLLLFTYYNNINRISIFFKN